MKADRLSHSHKAAVASFFIYIQFALALVSGVLLFPLVIKSVGVYAYGVWLATSETVSYVLLGDLGVFTVLPWLLSSRVGAQDYASLRQQLSNATTIGCGLGLLMLAAAGALFSVDVIALGFAAEFREHVLVPTALLLALHGASYPFKAFQALLIGLQDVYANGVIAVIQNLVLIGLTYCVIHFETGVLGLALAVGLPSLLAAVLSGLRVVQRHVGLLRGMGRPDRAGSRMLIREGFGAWLGGLGFRLMTASNGIIFASVGRPDWGTIYVSTSKLAQVLTPLCSTIPDSGLVGVSHVYAGGNPERTRRSVACLMLLYVVLPSFAAVGLLVMNAAFVTWWISPEMYAGHRVNGLLAMTLIVSGLAGGSVKLAAVVGRRQLVGWTTLAAGMAYLAAGYGLVRLYGLVGLALAALLVWTVILLPVGLKLLQVLYDLRLSDLAQFGLGRWLACSLPAVLLATILGVQLAGKPLEAFFTSVIAVAVYAISLRPLLELVPWPASVRTWLVRFSLAT